MKTHIATVQLSLAPSSNLTSLLGEMQSLSENAQTRLFLEQGLQLLLDAADPLHELFLVQSDIDATGGAIHLSIRLDPSDSLVRFVSAVRAGQRDDLIVKNIHEKDLMLVECAADSHPHHTSQHEAPINQEGLI